MNFDEHIKHVTSSAFRILGFIIRNTHSFTNIDTLKLLFNSLVRSKLEYAILIWDPGTTLNSEILETVQNKFIKYIYFKKFNHLIGFRSYDFARKDFKILKLSTRRIIIYRIIKF